MDATSSSSSTPVSSSMHNQQDAVASVPPPLHQIDADEDDENVNQLQDCASLYLALQDCLVNTNRDWRSCQTEVQALKACHEKRQKNQGKGK